MYAAPSRRHPPSHALSTPFQPSSWSTHWTCFWRAWRRWWTPRSGRAVYLLHRRQPSSHHYSRSQHWILATWRAIGQYPTWHSCWRMSRGLSLGKLSNICSQAVWWRGCSQLTSDTIQRRRRYYRFCRTFSALLTANTSHCSVYWTWARHSTVSTTIFLSDVCSGRSELVVQW